MRPMRYRELSPATMPEAAREILDPDGVAHLGFTAFLVVQLRPMYSPKTEKPFLLLQLDKANFDGVDPASYPPRQVAVFVDGPKFSGEWNGEGALHAVKDSMLTTIAREGRCGVIADLLKGANTRTPTPAFNLSYSIRDGSLAGFNIYRQPYPTALENLARRGQA